MEENMSDEIVEVSSQEVNHIPEEKTGKDGIVIPDSEVVEPPTSETITSIEQAREYVSNLPEYPKEWQQGVADDSKGFTVGASLKEKEINKLIKKYKRYMKSNVTEVKRLTNS